MFDLVSASRALIASATLCALLASPAGAEPLKVDVREAKGVVNINTASLEQLRLLWWTGEATAKAIIAGQPYKALSELDGVVGIGKRWAIVNGPFLTLEGPTTLTVKLTVPRRKADKPEGAQ